MASDRTDLPIPEALPLARSFRKLPDERLHTVLILNALLGMCGKWEGPDCHRILGEWVSGKDSTEELLWKWIQEKRSHTHQASTTSRCPLAALPEKSFDRARSQAEKDLGKGIWAVQRSTANPPGRECPQVLFGTGPLDSLVDQPFQKPRLRAAFFNSRKPRRISLEDEWLNSLRASLSLALNQEVCIVSSVGTMTYDLVSARAQRAQRTLLLIVPFPMEDFPDSTNPPTPNRVSALLRDDASHPAHPGPQSTLLTCLTRAAGCSKARRMVCRDQLVASLADLWWVLEIRSQGTLFSTLRNALHEQPRPFLIPLPKTRTKHNEGSFQLLNEWPQWSKTFAVSPPLPHPPNLPHKSCHSNRAAPDPPPPEEIRWDRYLYHYVRACPGPWPDQSYRDYLLSLLDLQDPLASHSALDTLCRIISQGLILAGSRITRGTHPSVSWTSVPPAQLHTIRKWNPALGRWTFEPYGIAATRHFLRQCGAQPAVYAHDEAYARIEPHNRFRFQRHEAPHCVWKHEREWRLPADLHLINLPPDQGFVFLPCRQDANLLLQRVRCPIPVVVSPT